MKKIKDYSQMLDVVTTKWQKVDKNISTVETYIEKYEVPKYFCLINLKHNK